MHRPDEAQQKTSGVMESLIDPMSHAKGQFDSAAGFACSFALLEGRWNLRDSLFANRAFALNRVGDGVCV